MPQRADRASRLRFGAVILALAVMMVASAPARADAIADFYRGKTVSMVVAAPSGGGYDLLRPRHARAISPATSRANPTWWSETWRGAGGHRCHELHIQCGARGRHRDRCDAEQPRSSRCSEPRRPVTIRRNQLAWLAQHRDGAARTSGMPCPSRASRTSGSTRSRWDPPARTRTPVCGPASSRDTRAEAEGGRRLSGSERHLAGDGERRGRRLSRGCSTHP